MSNTRSTPAHLSGTDSAASRSLRRVLGVLAFATATAIGAKMSVILPGTPVPFTFQPLVVMLAGALLGARLGAASQVAYLSAGVVGLPVFAVGGGAAYLLGPTGGYLLAYPLAAFVVGYLIRSNWISTVVALLAGLVVIYAGGISWLAALGSLDSALILGLQPFVVADLVKVALAAVIALRMRERALDVFAR